MQFKLLRNSFLLVLVTLLNQFNVSAQTETKVNELISYSKNLVEKNKADRIGLEKLAKKKGWPLQMKIRNGEIAILTGVYANGLPEYTATEDNLVAAQTIGTNHLWSGGELGLNLDGSSPFMKDKLAVWDGGRVRSTHIEFGANRIVFGDAATTLSDHATHVAGTMIAKGVNPAAKGMSFNAQNLIAYDFSSDVPEMAAAASGLLTSNHSYGSIAGWRQNSSQGNRWEFWGDFGATEDFKFGYYSQQARQWDSIAFLAPNYLIVKSAGNNRNVNGPAVGANYWRYNTSGVMFDAGPRPADISSNNSYDIIATYATAKNILTVGAVNPISAGYQRTSDVVLSSFSSWGPTDDGRIKPDVVANGVGLLSSSSTDDNSYLVQSGTSMAAPNASGSIFLLQEHFNKLNTGNFMRSATLKGLVIHTADEAGFSPGPDYQFGWGLINMKKAANVITNRNTISRILEYNLAQGTEFTMNAVASGTGPLVATISWTDPPATVEEINYLNNRTPKLINDLDLEITQGSNTFLPWRLNGLDPAAVATRGINNVDNVEKVEIDNPIPGETYTVKVKHKGTLLNNAQAYSMILSGVGGTPYCTSGPTSNNDSRIDNFKFGGIDNSPSPSCREYSNFTNLRATVFPGQSLPLSVSLGTCGNNLNKIAKVYIDWNGDGNFNGANELVATTNVITGTGSQAFNINVPVSIIPGNTTRIRVVCVETADPASVTPCGTYAKGETQDYLVTFTKMPVNVRPIALILPDNATCAADSIHFAVQVKNVGNDPVTNIPVTLRINNGPTTVETLLDTIKVVVSSEAIQTLYFKRQFNAAAGINYQITAFTHLSGDLDNSNDTIQAARTFLAPSNATLTNAKGQLCSPTDAYLSVTSSGGTIFWYDSPNSKTPIGIGNTFTTNIIPGNRTYHIGINDASGRVGPASKNSYPQGGFSSFSPIINIEALSPTLIESARFFIGSSGRISIKVNNAFSGAFVASTTLDVVENAALDEGTVYPLNLKIPAAGSYSISFTFENGATAYRHNGASNNIPYPFTFPGLIRIIGNNQNPMANFYYYLYDMKVKSLDCPKPMPRLSVVAANPLTPVISQNGNVLTSSVSTGQIQWYLNGNIINGANGPTHTLNDQGLYTVSITQDGCFFLSPEFNAIITSVPQLNPNEINLVVSNNPGNGLFNVMFHVRKREKITIEVSNIAGQRMSREEFTAPASGSIQRTIDISNKASGVYLMKIFYDNKQYTHKLVVE